MVTVFFERTPKKVALETIFRKTPLKASNHKGLRRLDGAANSLFFNVFDSVRVKNLRKAI